MSLYSKCTVKELLLIVASNFFKLILFFVSPDNSQKSLFQPTQSLFSSVLFSARCFQQIFLSISCKLQKTWEDRHCSTNAKTGLKKADGTLMFVNLYFYTDFSNLSFFFFSLCFWSSHNMVFISILGFLFDTCTKSRDT